MKNQPALTSFRLAAILLTAGSALVSQPARADLTGSWSGWCAFSTGSDNLDAADRALGTLAKAPEFAQARVFKKETARLASIADAQDRVRAYFSVAAVTTPSEIARFLGAKEDEQKPYAAIVAKRLALNERQATQVVRLLAAALRGDSIN